MSESTGTRLKSLDVTRPIWDRFFTIAPLVVIGSREPEGGFDLAAKHMAMPFGWGNYYGFICTPSHHTYTNIQRDGVFTVSMPRPDQVVLTSLTAAPRCEEGAKPALDALPTLPAIEIEGVFLRDAWLCLECELDRIVDGFGINSLIVGSIVGAQVDESCLRMPDADDHDVIARNPLLAYLPPGRYAKIDESSAFPFHAGFKR